MHLKEIIISGFKSFADRTRIILEPGVTCIVGPNGCGKSNIVDAIRWVLGEQSAKALRGGKMQDVIFEGTDKRKPLPQCEVALLFTQCEDQLGTAFHEVEIKRRANRDGGSDYYLNGKSCRLKDIQRLFMDTGIGRVSYSFMVQGQIDQILSTNPAERRLIFEEAAGVTKYKSQRTEALQKLTTVDQNLSRINDVVVEVDRQSGLLKSQAIMAMRYQRLKKRFRHLDLAYQAYQWGMRDQAATDLGQKMALVGNQLQEKQKDLQLVEKTLDEKRTARAALTLAVEQAQEKVFTLKTQQEDALHKKQLAETRCADLGERSKIVLTDIAELQNGIALLQSKTGEQKTNTQLQLNLVSDVDLKVREQTQALEALHATVIAAEKNLFQKRSERDQVEAKIKQARQVVNQSEVELQTTQAQTTHGQEALGVLESQLEQARMQLKKSIEQEQHFNQQRSLLDEQLKQAHEGLQQARQVFRQEQDQLQKADRALAEKKAQLNVLQGLQEKLEGCSEAARHVLKMPLGASGEGAVFGLLASELEVETGYERAVEAVLGILVDALLPLKPFDKESLLALIQEKPLGRLCVGVEPVMPLKSAVEGFDGVLLKDKVSVLNPVWQPWVERLLEGVYCIEDEAVFLKTWEQSAVSGLLMGVTLSGHVWDHRGFWYILGAAKGQGMIQRRTDIKRLEEAVQTLDKQRAESVDRAEASKTALLEAEQQLQLLDKQMVALRQDASAVLAEKKALDGQVLQAEQSLQKSRSILQGLSDRYEQASKRLAEATQQLKEAEQVSTGFYQTIQDLEKSLEDHRLKRDLAREQLSGIKIDLSEKKQYLEALQQGKYRLESEHKQLLERLAARQKEAASADDMHAQLMLQIKEAAIRIEEGHKLLASEMEILDKHREGLKMIEHAVAEKEKGLSAYHQVIRELEVEHVGLSKRFNEESIARETIVEKIAADYELDIRQVLMLDEVKSADQMEAVQEAEWVEALKDLQFISYDPEAIEWPRLTKELKQLKQQIQAMGAVNVLAIGEYTELKARSAFIHEQVKDLTQARDALLKAIAEINETSQALFEDTFKKVRVNFKATFDKLFGGGSADLELIKEADVLESGIEIIACPPGTKLKNLTLLSGGQKTMTAVALLFAIYQVKPSPFCVLDELDAPLDDANIGRFTEILKEYTAFSQFLVITHNKRTISAANILYGVTMPERGVTQLVSLKFESDA